MNSSAWILVVEDESLLGTLVVDNLRREGYTVELCSDGESAWQRIQQGQLDLVVLDLMLPRMHGLDVLRELRGSGNRVPVLVLSALGRDEQRIQGLQLGADDYLTKPFQLDELLLRVANLLRRSKELPHRSDPLLRFGGNVIDVDRHVATCHDGKEEKLTAKETMLLRYLAGNAGHVIPRAELVDAIWGSDADPTLRTIDNFIARFRKIFEADPRKPQHFHTLRGVGYRFDPEPNDS